MAAANPRNIRSYDDVKAFFEGKRRPKDSYKVANNTYLRREGENFVLRLHWTDIITYTPSGVVYNSGGYQSNTTKARFNDFGVASVYQRDYAWYVGDDVPFQDGMTFPYPDDRIAA